MPAESLAPLSLTAPEPPERAFGESSEAYARRVTKWRADNAKWSGQLRALERLEPPPQVERPRAPWATDAMANEV